MSFVYTVNPDGGVFYKRAVEVPFSKTHLLERILSAENVRRACKQVRANKGASGIDGVTVHNISALQIFQNLLPMPNAPDIRLGLWLKFLIRSIKIMCRVLIRLFTFQFVTIQILFKSKNHLQYIMGTLASKLFIYFLLLIMPEGKSFISMLLSTLQASRWFSS